MSEFWPPILGTATVTNSFWSFHCGGCCSINACKHLWPCKWRISTQPNTNGRVDTYSTLVTCHICQLILIQINMHIMDMHMLHNVKFFFIY